MSPDGDERRVGRPGAADPHLTKLHVGFGFDENGKRRPAERAPVAVAGPVASLEKAAVWCAGVVVGLGRARAGALALASVRRFGSEVVCV